MTLYCPFCHTRIGQCPECGKAYEHGTAGHCDTLSCMDVNAPVDCECGRVVSSDAKGILDYEMTFHAFVRKEEE